MLHSHPAGNLSLGIKWYQLQVNKIKISHGDVMYCVGNIVNNILITLYGDTWSLNLS